MQNCSSSKLELLALKWAITEKFQDYLLGSMFMVYTHNNPLAYVQESKLGVCQIWWLSELALFNLQICLNTIFVPKAKGTLISTLPWHT